MKIMTRRVRLAVAAGAVAVGTAAGAMVLTGGTAQAASGLPNYPASVYCYSGPERAAGYERALLTQGRLSDIGTVSYTWSYQIKKDGRWQNLSNRGSWRSGDVIERAYTPNPRTADQICASFSIVGPYGTVNSQN